MAAVAEKLKLPEVWKPVTGFEGLYEVSDHGRVRSIDRVETIARKRFGKIDTHSRARTGKLVSLIRKRRGYLGITLWKEGKPYFRVVHRLVLEAFIGPRPSAGHVGRHLNGNPAYNFVANLAWGTHADNVDDSIKHETWTHGEKHGMAKLTEDKIRTIRMSSKTQRQLAKDFGVSQGTIWQIKHRNYWKHVDA
jgi:hypothetical protein